MKKRPRRSNLFEASKVALDAIRDKTAAAALKTILLNKYDYDPPLLGLPLPTAECQERRRKTIEEWAQPSIPQALEIGHAAVEAVIDSIFWNYEVLTGIASAYTSQKQRQRSSKRKHRRGGRPLTVPWRITVREVLEKNRYVRTPEEMMARLAARGEIRIEGEEVVVMDKNAAPNKKVGKKDFARQVSNLINEVLSKKQ